MTTQPPDFHALLADDSYAATFQSLSKYRSALLRALPVPSTQHPDDEAVDQFAAAMKAKLESKRQEGKGGWQTASAEHLSKLLYQHLTKGDPVDVANFAMMLHQNGQSLTPLAPIPVSERLPGPEDRHPQDGWCWWWRTDGVDAFWEPVILLDPVRHNSHCEAGVTYGPWAPYWAIPLPEVKG